MKGSWVNFLVAMGYRMKRKVMLMTFYKGTTYTFIIELMTWKSSWSSYILAVFFYCQVYFTILLQHSLTLARSISPSHGKSVVVVEKTTPAPGVWPWRFLWGQAVVMVWVMGCWKEALSRLGEVQQSGARELCAHRTGAQTPGLCWPQCFTCSWYLAQFI